MNTFLITLAAMFISGSVSGIDMSTDREDSPSMPSGCTVKVNFAGKTAKFNKAGTFKL